MPAPARYTVALAAGGRPVAVSVPLGRVEELLAATGARNAQNIAAARALPAGTTAVIDAYRVARLA